MDEIDHLLIDELGKSARQSSSQIGKKLGLSSSNVRRRIAGLLKKGMISVVALPNPVAMGYNAWAIIGINVAAGTAHHVANKLLSYPQCYLVSRCLGHVDVVVAAYFKSADELMEFVSLELPTIEGVLRTETTMMSMPHKYYSFAWPLSKDAQLRRASANQAAVSGQRRGTSRD